MRPILALGAAGLTAIAALVSRPALAMSADGWGRIVASIIAAAWTTAGAWISVLLVLFVSVCACSRPIPLPEATDLGFTATTYHLIAMYGATALLLVAAFGRSAFLDRPVGRSGRLG